MCAIIGIYGQGLNVPSLMFFALEALQHRGQDSSGMSVANGEKIFSYRGAGLVKSVFTLPTLKFLKGHIGVGHNRYTTSLDAGLVNAQPVVINEELTSKNKHRVKGNGGTVVVAHNGTIPDVTLMSAFLKSKNIPIEKCSDSRMMALVISVYMQEGLALPEALKASLPLFTGAYSLVCSNETTLVAMRDQCGIRPLSIARLGEGYVIASETCAFRPIKAQFWRDIEPGEMIVINEQGLQSEQVLQKNPKLDMFELVYFSSPASHFRNENIYQIRKRCGEELFQQCGIVPDVVFAVPDTASPVAVGYAQASGAPLETGIIKNPFHSTRSFMNPTQELRELAVRAKFTLIESIFEGKIVVMIDDSIVRGTVSKQTIKMLYEAGAKEVHFLVSSPPVKFPDFHGINISKQEDLIAATKTREESRKFLGAKSLHYLLLERLIVATRAQKDVFSTACFTGEYPISIGNREKDFTYNVPTS